MAIWSHYKASITDPGKITHNINPFVVEFYINIHETPIRRAERFNQSYGKMLFEKMDEEDQKMEDEDEVSEYDDTEYEPVTSVPDDVMNRISKEYKVELKRCDKCYMVRTPRVHHCSVCKGCVMKMDHHCPWINNCVGQFNQKFFIQFCFYCLIGCTQAAFITLYYLVYKNKKEFWASNWLIFAIVIQLIFSLIFTIFTICMLNDQWSIIQNDTTLIDMKQKKFLEKREISEVVNETFGTAFGLHWFLPIKTGGYKPFFNKLKSRED